MPRLLLAVLLFIPAGASAAGIATFSADRSLIAGTPSPGNSSVAGASVIVAAPIGGDLSGVGGSLVVTAPVAGDALLVGGSVQSRAKIGGDLRVLGGSVAVEKPVSGDFFAIGASVDDLGRIAGSTFVIGANVTLAGGVGGPVTIYANNVALAGDFAGDIRIVASGRVALAASTTVRGMFSYQAPEPAVIPASASLLGGVGYESTSFLASSELTHKLALASLGIFLVVRLLAALILAGLLAGLFPWLGEAVAARGASGSFRSILLTIFLGFAAFVAVPILALIFALTLIGIGLAILLGVCYALLALLSYLYAGILVGNLLARRFSSRNAVLWRDGVIGMFLFSLVGLIPVVGWIWTSVLMSFAAGALILVAFHAAFPKDSD